jgi:hypothetical protein
MIHDDALMIYVNKPTSSYNDIKIYYIIISIASYMSRSTTVAIFREVFFEEILQ